MPMRPIRRFRILGQVDFRKIMPGHHSVVEPAEQRKETERMVVRLLGDPERRSS